MCPLIRLQVAGKVFSTAFFRLLLLFSPLCNHLAHQLANGLLAGIHLLLQLLRLRQLLQLLQLLQRLYGRVSSGLDILKQKTVLHSVAAVGVVVVDSC